MERLPGHCYNKDASLTAERKTLSYTSVLGARRGQRGKLNKLWMSALNKTWKRWVSAGMEPAGSPVTKTDGDFSSPNAPTGTGKTQFKSTTPSHGHVTRA